MRSFWLPRVNHPLQRHRLQKLELQHGSGVNHCRAGGMSIMRLARCLRWGVRFDAFVFTAILRPFTETEASSTREWIGFFADYGREERTSRTLLFQLSIERFP